MDETEKKHMERKKNIVVFLLNSGILSLSHVVVSCYKVTVTYLFS
jgi:hypothetical protein